MIDAFFFFIKKRFPISKEHIHQSLAAGLDWLQTLQDEQAPQPRFVEGLDILSGQHGVCKNILLMILRVKLIKTWQKSK